MPLFPNMARMEELVSLLYRPVHETCPSISLKRSKHLIQDAERLFCIGAHSDSCARSAKNRGKRSSVCDNINKSNRGSDNESSAVSTLSAQDLALRLCTTILSSRRMNMSQHFSSSSSSLVSKWSQDRLVRALGELDGIMKDHPLKLTRRLGQQQHFTQQLVQQLEKAADWADVDRMIVDGCRDDSMVVEMVREGLRKRAARRLVRRARRAERVKPVGRNKSNDGSRTSSAY